MKLYLNIDTMSGKYMSQGQYVDYDLHIDVHREALYIYHHRFQLVVVFGLIQMCVRLNQQIKKIEF